MWFIFCGFFIVLQTDRQTDRQPCKKKERNAEKFNQICWRSFFVLWFMWFDRRNWYPKNIFISRKVRAKIWNNWDSHHSLVDLSAPTILQSLVRIPNPPSTLFQFMFELCVHRTTIKQKRGRDWPTLKKILSNLSLK